MLVILGMESSCHKESTSILADPLKKEQRKDRSHFLNENIANQLTLAFDLLEQVRGEWTWANDEPASIHLYEESIEWLIRCPGNAPKSFRLNGQTLLGSAVYVNTSPVTFYDATEAFQDMIKAVPATIGYYNESIPRSTQYQERPWYVLATLPALIEGHPAFDESTSTEVWLGMLIHEFFHLSQIKSPIVAQYMSNEEWTESPTDKLK